MMLKGQGYVTVNKPVISLIYIVAHTWPLCFCTEFGGWGESTIKLLLKIYQYLCNRARTFCLFLDEVQESIFKIEPLF